LQFLGDFPHLNRIRILELEEKRSSAAFLALKERALRVSWEDYLRKILLCSGSEVATADTGLSAKAAAGDDAVTDSTGCPTTLEMNLGDSSVQCVATVPFFFFFLMNYSELYEYFLSK